MISNAPAALTDTELKSLMEIVRGLKTSDQVLMVRLLLRLKQTHEMCEEYRVAWTTIMRSLHVERRVN